MKLIDLNPRWVGAGGPGITNATDGSPVPEREGIGISFDCPCGCDTPVFATFRNPLDGGGPHNPDGTNWEREGDDFDTLTISPSILLTSGCKWHGFVRNGEIVNA